MAGTDIAALTRGALDWLMAQARETESGLAWTDHSGDGEPTPMLYNGGAGIVATLLEAYAHFGDTAYADAAVRGARTLAATVDDGWELSSLYAGQAGLAFVLNAVHDVLGDTAAQKAAARALATVRARFDGERWGEDFELLLGNAGIALAAAQLGDLELAVLAVTPYLRTAEPTEHGVQWEEQIGRAARFHHFAHGTLGVVYALATIGAAADRRDLIELALAGAADVVSRDEAGPAGFLVPHSDPQHRPDVVARYSYGWCNGTTGDAQAFRGLRQVTGDPGWSALADRCWHTVTHSGLPQRPRPGFWDNNGRCCGTAGVLALACDRHVEQGGDLGFADVLVDDLVARATVDADGVRWSNVEHRATPSTLPPYTGWAMGNAGIVRELLRYLRVRDGGDPGYAVEWPDHPRAVPAR
jgi:hypothetical protein